MSELRDMKRKYDGLTASGFQVPYIGLLEVDGLILPSAGAIFRPSLARHF
jgi:hypothetical protein